MVTAELVVGFFQNGVDGHQDAVGPKCVLPNHVQWLRNIAAKLRYNQFHYTSICGTRIGDQYRVGFSTKAR
jgi:hypothetical protein